jgi:hypothetical protein
MTNGIVDGVVATVVRWANDRAATVKLNTDPKTLSNLIKKNRTMPKKVNDVFRLGWQRKPRL